MAAIVNARDVLLQAAGTRLEPVTLPANMVVPNAQVDGLGDLALQDTAAATQITGQLTDAQLAAIAAGKITGQLSDSQLAAIAAAKVTGQITGTQITDGAVSTPKLAAGAVTANEIAAGAVVAGKIAANAVTATELAAGAVTTAKLVAYAVTADKMSVSTLSAITANLGSVTAGEITGTAGINITGNARFRGAYTGAVTQAAVYANESLAATDGVFGLANWGSGVYGLSTNNIGVLGSSTNWMGVSGYTSAASQAGVRGNNGGGGPSVECVTSFKWGSYTYSTPAGSSVTCLHNDGVWRDPVTTARVNSAFGVAAAAVCQIVVGDTGTCTVGGGGFNLVTGTGLSGTYQFRGTGNIVYLEAVSDRRLKQDIEDETLGLSFINSLAPKTYRMKAKPAVRSHGFIAQDVELLVPEGDSLRIVNDNGVKGIDYVSLIGPLVLAVQQLSAQVQQLKAGKP